MSKQYEIHLSGGAVVYVTNATHHSTDLLGTLTLQNAKYAEVARFNNPQGFLYTTTADPEPVPAPQAPAPAPIDDVPF